MNNVKRIVVLSAFSDEIASILQDFQPFHDTTIAKCRCWVAKHAEFELIFSLTGIGTSASAITTSSLCQALNPSLIIFCGVAGGLTVGQQIGDLVLATNIIDVDLYLLPDLLRNTPYQSALQDPHLQQPIICDYPTHPAILEIMRDALGMPLSLGVIATTNTFPAPKNLFHIIKDLRCAAIEMESSGMYKAAAHYAVPVMTIRAISNLLDELGNDLGTTADALPVCAQQLSAIFEHTLQHMPQLMETMNG